jgi:hypothetical protein
VCGGRLDLRTHLRVGLGHGVQAFAQRLEVQHGAAHQQRQAARARASSAARRRASAAKRAAE